MIWLTWRQQRLQLLVGTAALAVVATFLLVTGLGIASTFRSSGLAACLTVPGRDCSPVADAFTARYIGLSFMVPLFLILPAALGIFSGAPLVAREVEQGTHRLAWTQGVTRDQWIRTKIIGLIAATVVGVAVISLILFWWSKPLVAADDSGFRTGIFDLRGIVPVAYALFAVALGVAAGTIIRRTVPAMAATVGVFAGVRLFVALWLRKHYAAPKTSNFPLFGRQPGFGQHDWIISTKTLDGAGRVMGNGQTLDLNLLSGRCPALAAQGRNVLPNQQLVQECVHRLGLHAQVVYQPGSRYWPFQGIESAIFVALAFGLLAFSAWLVKHKVS